MSHIRHCVGRGDSNAFVAGEVQRSEVPSQYTVPKPTFLLCRGSRCVVPDATDPRCRGRPRSRRRAGRPSSRPPVHDDVRPLASTNDGLRRLTNALPINPTCLRCLALPSARTHAGGCARGQAAPVPPGHHRAAGDSQVSKVHGSPAAETAVRPPGTSAQNRNPHTRGVRSHEFERREVRG